MKCQRKVFSKFSYLALVALSLVSLTGCPSVVTDYKLGLVAHVDESTGSSALMVSSGQRDPNKNFAFGPMTASDDLLAAEFTLSSLALRLCITNKSAAPLTVLFDQARLAAPSETSTSVSFAPRRILVNEQQQPWGSVMVPPAEQKRLSVAGGMASLFPTGHLFDTQGTAVDPNATLTLILPVQTAEGRRTYHFTFSATEAAQRNSYY